jgi:hypothetical protein
VLSNGVTIAVSSRPNGGRDAAPVMATRYRRPSPLKRDARMTLC